MGSVEVTGPMMEAGIVAHEKQYAAEPLDDMVAKVRAIYLAMHAAALREQPEARGVVIERDSRGMISAVYENGKLSAANPEYVVDTRTAAQQQGQEGGGEVLARGWLHRHGPGDDYDLHDESSGAGKDCPECVPCVIVRAAPPSAPVGVESDAVTVALAKCRDVLRSLLRDKKCGAHYSRANAACHEATAALAQQPAQAAPGDVLVHGRECERDPVARDVCEGMYSDKCDDVAGLCEALRAVYSLAGGDPQIKKIVDEAIEEHGN